MCACVCVCAWFVYVHACVCMCRKGLVTDIQREKTMRDGKGEEGKTIEEKREKAEMEGGGGVASIS